MFSESLKIEFTEWMGFCSCHWFVAAVLVVVDIVVLLLFLFSVLFYFCC